MIMFYNTQDKNNVLFQQAQCQNWSKEKKESAVQTASMRQLKSQIIILGTLIILMVGLIQSIPTSYHKYLLNNSNPEVLQDKGKKYRLPKTFLLWSQIQSRQSSRIYSILSLISVSSHHKWRERVLPLPLYIVVTFNWTYYHIQAL